MENQRKMIMVLTIFLLIIFVQCHGTGRPDCGENEPVCTKFSKCSKRSAAENIIIFDDVPYAFFKYNCRCDSNCDLFGDCCVDAEKMDLSQSQNRFIDTKEIMKCGFPEHIETYGLEVYHVSKCPSRYDNNYIRNQCENREDTNIVQNWPVTDKHDLLYANVFCAICVNGIYNARYAYLNPYLRKVRLILASSKPFTFGI